MKNLLEKYRAWKLERIRKWAQWYADLIVRRLEEAKSDWEFDFWLMKGHELNLKMIHQYNIYLD
jgi:hypothetical protein